MRQRSAGFVVLTTLGLACYWPFFRRFEFSLFFMARPNADQDMLLSYALVMGLCATFAIAAIAAHKPIERFIASNRPLAGLASCASAAGYLLLLLVPSLPATVIASTLLGLGSVALTCIWAVLITSQHGNRPLICIAISLPISSLLSLAILLPEPTSLVLAVASPLISVAAWLSLPLDPPIEFRRDALFSLRKQLPLSAIGIFGLFIIVGHLIVGALYQTDGFIPVSERLITTVLSSATLLFVAVLLAKSSAADKLLEKEWVMLATFYLAAAFLVLCIGPDSYHLGTGIIAAELSCFETFFWILLAFSVRQTRLSPVFAFCGGFLLLKTIPVGVAKLLLPSLFEWLDLRLIDYTAAFVAVMTFMLVVLTVVLLNTHAFVLPSAAETPNDSTKSPLLSKIDACAQIAAEANLTPREKEVMSMIAQGHSLKKIGETLFISIGTVQGHAKHIYRKLGVHSKQELIDLVNERD
ncbi:hypothetical protein B5F40_09085 [Gordonibacter sp. An230]|uniref:response regulator transcription factor n=1 Tax=Gordonibacter sp. An230 TaxID=1965592 RepID=UPI000B3AF3D6|nr:helix-turn-helix transcriptional regulator [Gordonibacter sp. An230]OUO89827.1 hypothetical protein B5F40_09085 [Gordonibacter sp. An230]